MTKKAAIKILKVVLIFLATVITILNWTPNAVTKIFNRLAMLGLPSKAIGISISAKDSNIGAISWGILAIFIGVLILTKKITNLNSITIFWIVVVSIILEQIIIAVIL